MNLGPCFKSYTKISFRSIHQPPGQPRGPPGAASTLVTPTSSWGSRSQRGLLVWLTQESVEQPELGLRSAGYKVPCFPPIPGVASSTHGGLRVSLRSGSSRQVTSGTGLAISIPIWRCETAALTMSQARGAVLLCGLALPGCRPSDGPPAQQSFH